MLKELLRNDVDQLYRQLVADDFPFDEPDLELFKIAIAICKFMLKMNPNDAEIISRLALAHHLNGELRTAGRYYESVLQMEPPKPLTDSEMTCVLRYAPILYVNPQECFALMDVVAIHHPQEPLIAYHLFWEDDYDFPDDYEPCDHEVIWIRYDTASHDVQEVSTFFHSSILSTERAVEVANEHDGHAHVYIEWGKHGSLLDGWEDIQNVSGAYDAREVMQKNYQSVSQGGRVPLHPLKRRWPEKFHGSYADYVQFTKPIMTEHLIVEKSSVAKTRFANAVLQQQFLRYNFHPKFNWPRQVLEAGN